MRGRLERLRIPRSRRLAVSCSLRRSRIRITRNSLKTQALITPATSTAPPSPCGPRSSGPPPRAAIAMWPTQLGAAASAASENRTLAIADGRFDQQRIEAYALHVGGHAVKRGALTIYEVPGKPLVAFEFLSATRVIMASGKNATNLDRKSVV